MSDLIAMRPRTVRGRLAPGERFPGGARLGRRQTSGLDFEGVSPYAPGDDVRWIDWRATARTGQPQMRRFAAEAHSARALIVDLWRGMFFGTRDRLMAHTAVLAAARLAWEALSLHEPVGYALPPRHGVERPRRGLRQVLRFFSALVEAHAVGLHRPAEGPSGASLAEALDEIVPSLRRGDEIVVVSDFSRLDEAFGRRSRELSEAFRLRAFLVSDAFQAGPPPTGHYPVHGLGHTGREAFHIADGTAGAEGTYAATTHDLQDLGWRVAPADLLIPSREGPAS